MCVCVFIRAGRGVESAKACVRFSCVCNVIGFSRVNKPRRSHGAERRAGGLMDDLLRVQRGHKELSSAQ